MEAAFTENGFELNDFDAMPMLFEPEN